MNIAELTRQLREEIWKQYGVEADLAINIHNHWEENSHINRQTAAQLSLAIGRIYENANITHWNADNIAWVSIDPDYSEHTEIAIFYPEVSHG